MTESSIPCLPAVDGYNGAWFVSDVTTEILMVTSQPKLTEIFFLSEFNQGLNGDRFLRDYVTA